MRSITLLLLACGLSFGQVNSPALHAQIEKDFADFNSKDWTKRGAAFLDLTSIGCPACNRSTNPVEDGIDNAIHSGAVSRDDMSAHLIALLTTEGAFHAELFETFMKSGQQQTAPQGYYDYLPDLIMAVVHMRDPRSLPALLPFIGSGDMAASAIASFGEPALQKTLALLDSPPPYNGFGPREGGCGNPSIAFYPRCWNRKTSRISQIRWAARAAIKERLTVAAMSESHIWSRLAAIEGLGKLGDPDSVALLRSIAGSDSTQDPQGRPGRNLVREEASKALAKKTP